MAEPNLIKSALGKLGKAVIISNNINQKLCPKYGTVSKEMLASTLPLVVECVEAFRDFQVAWFESECKGKEAISQSELEVDLKLFMTEKLDFKQMKKVMERLKYCNSILNGLNFIQVNFADYKDVCEKNNFEEGIENARKTQKIINFMKESIQNEHKGLEIQLENSNIYNQNKKLELSVLFAGLSLLLSGLALVFTIL